MTTRFEEPHCPSRVASMLISSHGCRYSVLLPTNAPGSTSKASWALVSVSHHRTGVDLVMTDVLRLLLRRRPARISRRSKLGRAVSAGERQCMFRATSHPAGCCGTASRRRTF
jgi:hypothetical protein